MATPTGCQSRAVTFDSSEVFLQPGLGADGCVNGPSEDSRAVCPSTEARLWKLNIKAERAGEVHSIPLTFGNYLENIEVWSLGRITLEK